MAPEFQAASLYLDATYGAKVLRGHGSVCRAIAQEFPISAKRLPVNKWPGQRQVRNTLKLLLFNSLLQARTDRGGEGGTPILPACLYTVI